MAKKPDEISAEVKAKTLVDYKNESMTTEEIAAKHGVSAATVTVWAKKAGIPLRTRGRWKQELPTAKQAEILRLCDVYTYQEVADKMGMFKQSIHRIAKRWRTQIPPTKLPFVPGDMFVWKGKKMTVQMAGVLKGTVVDERGSTYKNFIWGRGRIPKKIGVNPSYLQKQA